MKKKKLFAAFAAVAILSSAFTVFASSTLQNITAQINYGIGIVYNGEKQTMYDANGAQVYPITYNGTTYVPIRAVSNIFGVAVDWDQASNAVILGSQTKQPVNLFQLSGLSTTKYSWVIKDSTELTYSGSDGTSTYTSGLVFDIWNGTYSVATERVVQLPTNGKYSTVNFTATSDIDCVARLYDQDMNVITSFNLSAGSIVSKEIDISGTTSIAFGADAQNTTAKGTFRVFDATAK